MSFATPSPTDPLTGHNPSSLSQRYASAADSSIEYQLQQLGHNNQLFISLDADDSTCFAVNFRSTIAAWCSKPHISIESVSAGRKSEVVSTIRFNPTPSQIPWIPKALVTYAGDSKERTMEMKAPLSLKWHVEINGTDCTWSLSYNLPSLILAPRNNPTHILAVFTWGARGNRVRSGQEIGRLRMVENQREKSYSTQVLSTAAAVVAHWKSAGKFLPG